MLIFKSFLADWKKKREHQLLQEKPLYIEVENQLQIEEINQEEEGDKIVLIDLFSDEK